MSQKVGRVIAVIVTTFAVAGVIIFYPVKVNLEPAEITQVAATKKAPTATECLAELPLDFITGQLLMVGINAPDMASQADLFKANSIGGAILMTAPADPNDGSINQFKQSAASNGVMPLISTDEEGGDVQRFAVLGELPSQAEVAQTTSTANAKKLIKQHGEKLKAVGIDMVLGPVADIAPANGSSVLGNRVFSSDPQIVRKYTLAYETGWRNAGILPTLKHFPGLGSATANTDFAPATTPEFNDLASRDFAPYHQIYPRRSAIMVGHQNVPGWLEGPASLSPLVNAYLRNDLGYKNNLVVTDALNATAITNGYSLEKAVTAAIIAGNDLALYVEYTSDVAYNQTQISTIKTALQNAINTGALPKDQVLWSIKRKLNAQRIGPCSITSKNI